MIATSLEESAPRYIPVGPAGFQHLACQKCFVSRRVKRSWADAGMTPALGSRAYPPEESKGKSSPVCTRSRQLRSFTRDAGYRKLNGLASISAGKFSDNLVIRPSGTEWPSRIVKHFPTFFELF